GTARQKNFSPGSWVLVDAVVVLHHTSLDRSERLPPPRQKKRGYLRVTAPRAPRTGAAKKYRFDRFFEPPPFFAFDLEPPFEPLLAPFREAALAPPDLRAPAFFFAPPPGLRALFAAPPFLAADLLAPDDFEALLAAGALGIPDGRPAELVEPVVLPAADDEPAPEGEVRPAMLDEVPLPKAPLEAGVEVPPKLELPPDPPKLPRPPAPPPLAPPPVSDESCFLPDPLGRPLLPLGAPPPKRSSSSSSSSSSPSLTTVASESASSSSSASSALSHRRSL